MTYGRIYVKATVTESKTSCKAEGTGYVKSDSNETGIALSSGLSRNVDQVLQTAYDVRRGR